MLANRRNGRMIASLAVALLATSTLVPPATAGPISDMLARHRQAKAMKLPAVTKPHTIQSIKDPNTRTASLTQRFKQRFSLKRNSPSTATKDQSVIKTGH